MEKIPQSEQLNNAFIATPVKLEQCLMEGSYNKVVLTEKNIPSPFYTIFIRIMMDAVRWGTEKMKEKEEIIEKA